MNCREFGYEIVLHLPLMYYYHKIGILKKTVGTTGMKPFYYFSKEHVEFDVKRGECDGPYKHCGKLQATNDVKVQAHRPLHHDSTAFVFLHGECRSCNQSHACMGAWTRITYSGTDNVMCTILHHNLNKPVIIYKVSWPAVHAIAAWGYHHAQSMQPNPCGITMHCASKSRHVCMPHMNDLHMACTSHIYQITPITCTV